MAIKYFENPEKRQVVATMSNCEYDCYNKIRKLTGEMNFQFCPRSNKQWDAYLMPDTFRVVLNCDERDEYSFEEGKKIAKKKLMKNYYKALDKRLAKFKKSFECFVSDMNDKMP